MNDEDEYNVDITDYNQGVFTISSVDANSFGTMISSNIFTGINEDNTYSITKEAKVKIGDTYVTGEQLETCINYMLKKAKEEIPEEFV